MPAPTHNQYSMLPPCPVRYICICNNDRRSTSCIDVQRNCILQHASWQSGRSPAHKTCHARCDHCRADLWSNTEPTCNSSAPSQIDPLPKDPLQICHFRCLLDVCFDTDQSTACSTAARKRCAAFCPQCMPNPHLQYAICDTLLKPLVGASCSLIERALMKSHLYFVNAAVIHVYRRHVYSMCDRSILANRAALRQEYAQASTKLRDAQRKMLQPFGKAACTIVVQVCHRVVSCVVILSDRPKRS